MQKYNQGVCQVGQWGPAMILRCPVMGLCPTGEYLHVSADLGLGWGWFWWPGQLVSEKMSLWWLLPLVLSASHSFLKLPPTPHPTRSQSWNSPHGEPLVSRFLLLLKIKSQWKEYSLEASEADLDSNLPLSGCGLLASYLMFLGLNFWI